MDNINITNNTDNAIYFNFSYSALKLLGKNLYSNAANAISELVANGIDAKAKNVYVYIDMCDKQSSTIEIIDDGEGMSQVDLAEKYVWIGRNKRQDLTLDDNDKRNLMGRKGIGKLAALYLTNRYFLLTKKVKSEVEQWEINLAAYRDSDFPKLDRINQKINLINHDIWDQTAHGTVIRLENVDLRRNGPKRIEALKRVFTDFYLTDSLEANIYVAIKVNQNENVQFEKVEKAVAYKNFYALYDNTDLELANKMRPYIQFEWLSKYSHIANKKRKTIVLDNNIKTSGIGVFKDEHGNVIERKYNLKGWIGIHCTIEVKNAVDENFVRNDVYQPNKLRIYVRNKLAVNNFFEIHPNTQTMANYIEGEISFDILDDDFLPDIATSSRQDFLDDERVDLLCSLVDPIIANLFKVRNDVGNKIRSENIEHEEYLKKIKEEENKREREAREEAERQKQEAEQEARKAEEQRKEAETKQKQAEEQVVVEQKRSRYILNVSGVEDKNIMNSIHSIYNMACRVKENVDELRKNLDNPKVRMKKMEKIVISNGKILSSSKIISKAGKVMENNDANKQVDLPNFINEYVDTVLANIYEKSDIEILCSLNENENFLTTIKPLSFIMVMDNLVGNAIKANAKKLDILFENINEQQYNIIFQDNGEGIHESISEIEHLFEFGVTTTNGSGLGLFYAKKYMADIKGNIRIEQNKSEGISVILEFNKQKKRG